MKTMVLAGGVLAAAVLLTGCGLQNIGKPANQEKVEYTVSDKVVKLRLDSGSGNTEIREGSGDTVKVVETLKWSSDKPRTEHKVEGGTLVMTYDCPAAMDNCSVDYKVEVPKGLPLDLETGSGDIALKGVTGPIVASVGSGDLAGTGLLGKSASVKTGSGDTTLKYAAAPDALDLVTGSGNSVIQLPGGPYAVQAVADSGDATVTVKNDPSATRKVSVKAGSGDVSVLPG
ncbi:DUF4097 family beta strand repeat-containing protein [Nonomuraea sp. NPDC050790]|uniref:DUF4097 family beta strand repeat-containing protein n=1 Tax=Nonomuraea sp. NPDC050790 TaxID=3364371 RepID=UPI00378A299F